MLLLLLLWLLIGLFLGLLTLLARLHPTLAYPWLILPLLGPLLTLLTGLLGIFLLGKDVTTPLTLWVTIPGLFFRPRLLPHKSNLLQSKQGGA